MTLLTTACMAYACPIFTHPACTQVGQLEQHQLPTGTATVTIAGIPSSQQEQQLQSSQDVAVPQADALNKQYVLQGPSVKSFQNTVCSPLCVAASMMTADDHTICITLCGCLFIFPSTPHSSVSEELRKWPSSHSSRSETTAPPHLTLPTRSYHSSQLVGLLYKTQIHPVTLLTVNNVTQQLHIFNQLPGTHSIHPQLQQLLLVWQLLQAAQPGSQQGGQRGAALLDGIWPTSCCYCCCCSGWCRSSSFSAAGGC